MVFPRSILITGCSSGIGQCAAYTLRARGYRVFATARHPADVARLHHDGFESLLLDLNDSATISSALDTVLQRTGGTLYALFNNGGYGLPAAVEDLRRDLIRAQFETNVFGWVELITLVIPVMRRQGYGRIIQNSSILGLTAMPFRGAYNASKFAIEGLTDTLRQELNGSGIDVALIEPGPILTKFRENSARVFQHAAIDQQHSPHRQRYEKMLARLAKPGPAIPFTLPPDAVVNKLIHALESRRPKARYYVTFPTHLFAFLRRILRARALDRILSRL
ncbi:MAG: SDR family NAD(P)-dependent oxidoreductase [Gammaproteobacteria bacterium]|nr:SDR family NAD(P)-dependent oxidoreductase [Gammaproteobacteria bacterium]